MELVICASGYVCCFSMQKFALVAMQGLAWITEYVWRSGVAHCHTHIVSGRHLSPGQQVTWQGLILYSAALH